MSRPRGARSPIVLVLSALAITACGDSGPEGPGAFTAMVEAQGPPAGAVVMDVTGDGIEGFEGTGDTRVFSAEVDAGTGLHRLIAVSATGSLGFRVRVARVELGPPTAVVVDAAGTDNGPRGPAGLTVRIVQ